jgi:hypothetical protein
MGHSLVAAGGKLYLFGGFLAGLSALSNELFVLDPVNSAPVWQNISSSFGGSVPSARALHGAAVLNNNKLLICMGRVAISQSGGAGQCGDQLEH